MSSRSRLVAPEVKRANGKRRPSADRSPEGFEGLACAKIPAPLNRSGGQSIARESAVGVPSRGAPAILDVEGGRPEPARALGIGCRQTQGAVCDPFPQDGATRCRLRM